MKHLFEIENDNDLVSISITSFSFMINISGNWVKPVLNDIKLHLPDFKFSETKVHFANVVIILVLIASNFASHAHLHFQKKMLGSVKNNVLDVL